MTAVRFVAALFAAWMLDPLCGADHLLPSPTQLSYKWINPLTMNLTWSWKRPKNLPQNCEIKYYITEMDRKKSDSVIIQTHYSSDYLTEEAPSDRWRVSVHTVPGCSSWNKSQPVNVIISTPKPYMELVKDFKCFHVFKGLNCTWFPVNPSVDVAVSYRYSGEDKERKGLQKCTDVYRINEKKGCFMKGDMPSRVSVLVQSTTGMSSFQAQYATPVTKLSIKEKGDSLSLGWTAPPVGQACTWVYCVWYKECNEDKPLRCYNIKVNGTVDIPYKKCCDYRFQYNLSTDAHCLEVVSSNSDVVTYDYMKPCDQRVNAVVVVIPIILCFCVILSFCCFNRHKDIFCLKVPDRIEIKNLMTRIMDKKIPKDNVPIQPQEHTDSWSSFLNKNGDPQDNS